MSDQVVFTKDEAEKIKSLLSDYLSYLCSDCGARCPISDSFGCAEYQRLLDTIALFNAPRPRPKLPMAMMYILVNIKRALDMEGELGLLDERIELTANRFGFDVED